MAERLAALATLSPAQLRAEWRQLYRAPPPAAFTPDLLARGIAWRLQERAMGGLPSASRQTLARLTKQFDKTGDIRLDGVPPIKPGTRLVREWQGVHHHVTVTSDGYEHGDRLYRSLSQIAEQITGTRWLGPRFFGLTRGKGCGGG